MASNSPADEQQLCAQISAEQDELARQFFAILSERSGGRITPKEAHAEHFHDFTVLNGGVEPPELRAERERLWPAPRPRSPSGAEATSTATGTSPHSC
eukprot:tig00000769_g4007.t1